MVKRIIFIITISLIVLIALILILLPFVLKYGIEKGGTQLVGAKVELDQLKIGYHNLSLRLRRLQITNPNDTMKNIIDIGDIRYKMDPWSLLKGKIVIETIQVLNVRANTPRKYDGAIKRKTSNKTDQPKNSLLKPENILNLDMINQIKNFDYNSFINNNLQTVKLLNEYKETSIVKYEKWQEQLNTMKYHEDINQLYEKMKNFNVTTSNPIEITEKIKSITEIKTQMNSVLTTYQGIKNNFQKDMNDIHYGIKTVSSHSINDINGILAKANIKNFSVKDISSMIFSGQIMQYINQGLFWADKIKTMIPAKNQNQIEPVDQKSPIKPNKKPQKSNLFIKNIVITTSNKESSIKGFPVIIGEINNIIGDQDQTGQPASVHLQVQIPDFINAVINIEAVIDRRNHQNTDQYQVKISNLQLNDLDLSGKNGLPNKLSKAVLDLNTTIVVENTNQDFTGEIITNETHFSYTENNQDELSLIIKTIIENIKNLSLKFKISRVNQVMNISISSNLDAILKAKLTTIINQKVAELKSAIEQKYNIFFNQKRGEVLAELNKKESIVTQILNNKDKLFNDEKLKLENMLNTKLAELQKSNSQIENTLKDTTRNLPKLW